MIHAPPFILTNAVALARRRDLSHPFRPSFFLLDPSVVSLEATHLAAQERLSTHRSLSIEMASNLQVSKLNSSSSSPAVSPSASQASSSIGIDSASRRSGGSGSFGTGSSTRSSGGQPRKQQGSKNQHKHSRRYRLADEDALAESVSEWPI